MYFVEITGNEITAKGHGPALAEGQIEISQVIYDQLISLPAAFTINETGEIISVTPAPEPEPCPQPPSLEERVALLEQLQLAQMGV
jgi:hypothetical protein